MQESLQEFVDSKDQTLRVDAEQGVLRGVKLLGLASRNGRTYRESALAEAAGLYEGAKVNVNHPKGSPLTPRDYQDRLGVVRDVVFRAGEGLFASLYYNPKHPLAEQLAWDAEHAPEQVGLSHNVLAQTSRDGNVTMVEAITKVESVDLVADPATTRGLFEHRESSTALVEQLEAAQTELVRSRRKVRIYELLAEHGLPLPTAPGAAKITSPAFVESLEAARDEQTLASLIADRAHLIERQLAQSHTVESREQHWHGDTPNASPTSGREFAASIQR